MFTYECKHPVKRKVSKLKTASIGESLQDRQHGNCNFVDVDIDVEDTGAGKTPLCQPHNLYSDNDTHEALLRLPVALICARKS